MDERKRIALDAIFKPKTIALIGASNSASRWGYRTLKNLRALEYNFRIYPVNPTEKEIMGLPCFPDIKDIPDDIDLAIIVVNAAQSIDVVKACIEKKVKGGIMITAGFAEAGEEDRVEEQEMLAELAEESGFYFIGPNCWGVLSAVGNVNTIFNSKHPGVPDKGPVSFISQSGSLSLYAQRASKENGFGFEKLIGIGNQACIDFSDLLEYLADDDDTKVITGYMEDVKDGRKFIEAAKYASSKKPVLIFKSGSTEASVRAAGSHTGAMASNDYIFDCACKQAGIIRCYDLMQMFYTAEALSCQPVPRGGNVAVISGGGGFCVVTAEMCVRAGLDLPRLSHEAEAKIKEEMRGFAPPPVNPVDVIGIKGPQSYPKIVEILAQQDYIDALVVMAFRSPLNRKVDPQIMAGFLQISEAIASIPEKYNKPMIATTEAFEFDGPIYEIYKRHHVPCLWNPTDIANVIKSMVNYGELQERAKE